MLLQSVFLQYRRRLILIFSEIIPKTIGATYWRRLASPSAYVIRFLMIITFPFVWLSEVLSSKLSYDEDEVKKVSREEITVMAEMGEDEGILEEQETDLIENTLRLKDIKVNDVMTPRNVIFALNKAVSYTHLTLPTSDLV